MSNYIVSSTDLTSIANAIRTKGGTSSSLAFPSGFISAIEAIQTGGSISSGSIEQDQEGYLVVSDTNADVIYGHGTATDAHTLTLPIPSGYFFYIFMTDYGDSTVSGELLRISQDSFGWIVDKKNTVNVNRVNGDITGMIRNANSLTYNANNPNTVGVLVGGVDYTYIAWKEATT